MSDTILAALIAAVSSSGVTGIILAILNRKWNRSDKLEAQESREDQKLDAVVTGLAASLGVEPTVLYFGLLSGATLGGNCTPIGASANIAGIGILRKNGYEVKTRDFVRIGIPFTLAAVIPAYIYLWLLFGA